MALDVASDQSVEQLRSYLETNRGNTDTFTHLPTFIFIWYTSLISYYIASWQAQGCSLLSSSLSIQIDHLINNAGVAAKNHPVDPADKVK